MVAPLFMRLRTQFSLEGRLGSVGGPVDLLTGRSLFRGPTQPLGHSRRKNERINRISDPPQGHHPLVDLIKLGAVLQPTLSISSRNAAEAVQVKITR